MDEKLVDQARVVAGWAKLVNELVDLSQKGAPVNVQQTTMRALSVAADEYDLAVGALEALHAEYDEA